MKHFMPMGKRGKHAGTPGCGPSFSTLDSLAQSFATAAFCDSLMLDHASVKVSGPPAASTPFHAPSGSSSRSNAPGHCALTIAVRCEKNERKKSSSERLFGIVS